MDIHEVDDAGPRPIITVAVAINGNDRSKYPVKWCLDKFCPEGIVLFRILHVRPKISSIPTPMGNLIPISNVREDIVSAYKKDIEWKTNNMILPYKRMCAQRKVEAEAVVIESDDVAEAISEEISKFGVKKLVLGSSCNSFFNRKSKGCGMSTKISSLVPRFCTVYVVSKGKLLSVRASVTEENESTVDVSHSNVSSRSLSSNYSSANSETDMSPSYALHRIPRPVEHNQSLAKRNENHSQSRGISIFSDEDLRSSNFSMTEAHSVSSMNSFFESFPRYGQHQGHHHMSSTSDDAMGSMVSANQVDIEFEVEKLNIELKHLREICQMARCESEEASHQVNELSTRRNEEAFKLVEIRRREDHVRELLREERERREVAEREAEFVKGCALKESLQRRSAEYNAAREADQKLRLEKVLVYSEEPYKKFTWEEIEFATSGFLEDLKIGTGGYGTVYKGKFHRTVAAVKVLHSTENHGIKQFKQELEILSRIHHPHLLLLLGACPERGCLVYEYMENGSLDDRLMCKDNTPPLPWYYRYRIAWEVASALLFLHSSKPEPIIHRDLKPANILLDENFASKIGDAGLSTLLAMPNATTMTTMYKDTAPVGTLCYIDPEYQRSGLVSPKSDVYALGMVILQLLTAKSPMGLAYSVESALEEGSFSDILDHGAGKWPVKETEELASLGLSCTEMRRKDRPDLKLQILPILERLKGIADEANDLAKHAPSTPPNHFICPILQEVMDEPCVASDGYTYDRRAIEEWFRMNNTSPMTNLKLPNKDLIPNLSLRSAIKGWKPTAQC